MGWNAVLIAEEQGGAGGSFADLASIIEGLALHAVELPVATRCGIVPAMLNALRGSEPVRALLSDIAEGAAVVELGGPLCAAEAAQPLAARGGPSAWSLSGTTAELALTDDCTHVLLVCAAGDGSPMLACVDAAALRERATRYLSMDDRQVASCRLEALDLPAAGVLASGAEAERAIRAGHHMAVAAMATDTVCCMGGALARTVQYLLERQQFGQPLANFQALRHDVARLYVSYELARNLLQASLRAWDAADAAESQAGAFSLLGLFTGQEAVQFAETVIQLHGGMGMTREMPAARLATRLLANTVRFGDPLAHQQTLNQLRDRMPT